MPDFTGIHFTDNELFVVFLVAMIMFAAGVILNNERCLRNKRREAEAQRIKDQQRYGEIANSAETYRKAIAALFKVRDISNTAINDQGPPK